jgi:hypothetical protein
MTSQEFGCCQTNHSLLGKLSWPHVRYPGNGNKQQTAGQNMSHLLVL